MRRGENTCRLEFDSPSASPGSAGRVGGRRTRRWGGKEARGRKAAVPVFLSVFVFVSLFGSDPVTKGGTGSA